MQEQSGLEFIIISTFLENIKIPSKLMQGREMSDVKKQHYEPQSSLPNYANTNTEQGIKKESPLEEQPIGIWTTQEITILLDNYAETGNRFNFLAQKMKQNVEKPDPMKYSARNLERKIYHLIKLGLIIFLKNLKNDANLKAQFQMLKHALKKTYPKKLMDCAHEINSQSKIMLIRLNFCKKIPPSSFDQLFQFIKEPKVPNIITNNLYGGSAPKQVQMVSDDEQGVKQEKAYQQRQKEQKIKLIRQLRVCNKKLSRVRQPVFVQGETSDEAKQMFEEQFKKYTRILQDAIKKTGKRYASRVQPKQYDFTFKIMYTSEQSISKDKDPDMKQYKSLANKIFTRLDRLHKEKIFSKIDLIRLYRAIRGVWRWKQLKEKKLRFARQKQLKEQQQLRRKETQKNKQQKGQKVSDIVQKKFTQQLKRQKRGQNLRKVEGDSDQDDDQSMGSSVGDSMADQNGQSSVSKEKKQGQKKKRAPPSTKRIQKAPPSRTAVAAKSSTASKKVPAYELENIQNISFRNLQWKQEEQQQLVKLYKSLGKYLNGLSSRMKLEFSDESQHPKFEPQRLQIKLVCFIYRGLTILNQMNKVHQNVIKLSAECQRKISYLMASKIFQECLLQRSQHVKCILMDLSFRNKPKDLGQLKIVSQYIQKIVSKYPVERCQAIFGNSILENEKVKKINRLMIETGKRFTMAIDQQSKKKNQASNDNLLRKYLVNTQKKDKSQVNSNKMEIQDHDSTQKDNKQTKQPKQPKQTKQRQCKVNKKLNKQDSSNESSDNQRDSDKMDEQSQSDGQQESDDMQKKVSKKQKENKGVQHKNQSSQQQNEDAQYNSDDSYSDKHNKEVESQQSDSHKIVK